MLLFSDNRSFPKINQLEFQTHLLVAKWQQKATVNPAFTSLLRVSIFVPCSNRLWKLALARVLLLHVLMTSRIDNRDMCTAILP